MPERRVLILSQHHLAICAVRQGEVRREHTFELDEEGQAGFLNWAARHAATMVQLLVDLPDEGFHQETLPHVVGEDRKALLTRKLNQHFFGTPYSLVVSLGREKQGRRDENFLFAALTRPQALEPWLHAMHESGVAIVGIHSPALLLPRLLDRKTAAEPRLIIITQGGGGLRQSYFEHGQLRFSRLKPLGTDNIEEAAVNAYGEAVRIYQYLIGQRLISRGEKIPVLCIANPAHFDLLSRACVDTDELSFSFSSLQTIAQAKGLRNTPDDSSVDALLVHLLAHQPPSLQFGHAEARLGYLRWRWRNAIRLSMFATLALAGLFVIGAGISIWTDHVKRDEAQATAQHARQRYDSIVRGLPVVPVTPDQLRSLTDQWQQLQAHSPSLPASLQALSKALQENPKIELKALNWRLADSPNSSEVRVGDDAWLVIDIDAELPASTGLNRRTQSQSIDRFVDALKRNPGDEARILDRPFDTDSGKLLKGDNEVYAGKGALGFSVRYSRRNAT